MLALTSHYRFGCYEVRIRTRELYKHGVKLKLRPQPFQVLQLLAERAPDVVTREELRGELWSSDTFVDFEHGLNTSIKELRGVLNDSATEPRYIQTLPRLGYRMLAAVEVEAAAAARSGQVTSVSASPRSSASGESAVATPAAVPEVADEHKKHGVFNRWPSLAVTALLLLLATAATWRSLRPPFPSQPPTGRMMLAVLPFENLTGDAAQEYFSDGLTEEMISQLGRLDPQGLAVIARTSVMNYKHTQERLDQIGRELGVQYVLEGSVRRDAGTVRIAAQLIQVKDQTHLWAREYDRQLSSLLNLQGEIAQEVADEIQLTLKSEHKPATPPSALKSSPSSYEAYDLYLKGRYYWNKRTKDGFEQAIKDFQQAIAKDPNSSRAYAGLADAYALSGSYGYASPGDMMPKARSAALKALQLDEKLAEAHASLALITEFYDWDWQAGEKEFRRAIELDPNYATAHHWYAEYLSFQGRFDEALAESEQARRLDPLSVIIGADRGYIFYYSRQYERAIEQFGSALAMDPSIGRAFEIVDAFAQQRRFNEAFAQIESWRSARQQDLAWTWAKEAYVSGRAGDPGRAQRAFRELNNLKPLWRMDPAPPLVSAYLGLGRNDQALTTLETAYRQHSTILASLKVDPIYDPLRGDPRFKRLLKQVGLDLAP
jgi:TolB-like protein/DNA-binding winged helix-turn-helix (wHTH) protein/Tfp pilus assembly protein PilF